MILTNVVDNAQGNIQNAREASLIYHCKVVGLAHQTLLSFSMLCFLHDRRCHIHRPWQVRCYHSWEGHLPPHLRVDFLRCLASNGLSLWGEALGAQYSLPCVVQTEGRQLQDPCPHKYIFHWPNVY